MRPKSENPLNNWKRTHQNLRGTENWKLVSILFDAMSIVWEASNEEGAWEAYYADRTLPVPDLAKCAGLYGYLRLLVRDWTKFPIEVPDDDVEIWREWGIGASFDEFYERNVAGIAGGFLEQAVKDPHFTADTIISQVSDKGQHLIELSRRPVEWFTFAEYTEEQIIEGEDRWDIDRVVEIFDLMDELHGFVYGLPKLRDFAMTEEDEEFGLPNMDLYFALEEVDLNRIYRQLYEAEDKLLPILQHIAQQGRITTERDTAPEHFWWRHWKPGMRRPQPKR